MDEKSETSYSVPMLSERRAAPSQETTYRVPGIEPPPSEKDWENAGWGEVLSSGLRNAPASALHQITAIPEAIMNPTQTWEGMKSVGRGIAAKTGLGGSEDADQRAQDEAVVNAFVAPYTSIAGLKKSLATDPFEVLSTAGMALSGGATGAAKIGSTLAKTGTAAGEIGAKAANIGAKGLEGLSYAADPTKSALKVAGLAGSAIGKPAAARIAEQETGISRPALEQAFEAGASRDPAFKKSFNDYATGRGDPVAFSQDTSRAFEKMKSDEISKWASDKANLAQLSSTVDFAPAYQAINDFRSQIGPIQGGVGPEVRRAHDVLDAIENHLKFRESLPANDLLRTVEGVDQLKRSLYKDIEASSGYAADAYKQAWAGIRKSLSDAAPEYTNLMEKYQAVQDGLQNVQKTLGTGNRVAANTEMAKFIKQFGDSFGAAEIEKLAKYDPTIPYKVAGAAIHAAAGHPSNWTTGLSLAQLGNLGAGIFTGNPVHMAGALGGILLQKQLLSPKNVAAIPYYAGAISGNPVAQGIGEGASAARKVGTPALMGLQNAEQDEPYYGPRPLTIRPGRATGGRIMDAEAISDRLVRQADQVKKEVSNHTEQLLDTPDDHVAKALEIANRHI